MQNNSPFGLNDRSQRLITKYLAGGAAAGGSAALISSLANYIQSLKQKANAEKDTSEDDDTLYITLDGAGGNKMAGANDAFAGGIAMSGAALSSLGSYALVRKLYQQYKKKKLQEELDQAQQSFVDVQIDKPASALEATGKPMGLFETATSAPVAFTLLAALASGALTNKALDKTFPAIKRKQELGPKRIVLKKKKDPSYYETIEEDELNDEQSGKRAYDQTRNDDDIYDDGLEFIVHLTLNSKSASDLSDIIHAVAEGRGNEFVDNFMTYGYEPSMDLIKGASSTKLTELEKIYAVSTCVKSALLKPTIALLAASEYVEMAPHFVKAAQHQSEETKATLVKLAGIMGALYRSSNTTPVLSVVKQAAAMAPGGAGLGDIIKTIAQRHRGEAMGEESLTGQDDPGSEIQAPDSETSTEELLETDGNEENIDEALVKNKVDARHNTDLEEQPKDFIDSILNVSISPSKIVESN